MKNNSIIAKRVTEKLLKPKTIWGLSSAGRASALQAEGHRFEPYRPHLSVLYRYAAVAELADAQDLKSCGTNLPYRFDSGLRHVDKSRRNVGFATFLLFFYIKKFYLS